MNKKITKSLFGRASVMLLAFVFFGSILTSLFFFSPPVAADNSGTGTFEYKDIHNETIIEVRGGDTQEYHKSTGGNGVYNGGGAEGFDGCTAWIQTNSHKYDGDTHAKWWAGCLGGPDKTPTEPGKKSITIKAAHNYTGDWIDHSHIKVGGTIYYDNHIDDTLDFKATNQNNGCDTNVINGFPESDGGDITNAPAAEITINKPVSATNNNCVQTKHPVYFNNTQNFAIYFMWVDAGTIQTSDRTAMVYVQNGGGGPYLDNGSGRSSDSSCLSQIVPDSVGSRHGTLILRNSDGNPFSSGFSPQISGVDFHDHGGCKVSDPLRVNIGGNVNASKPPGSGDAGGADAGDAGGNITDCDTELTSPLSWILCPLIDIGSNVSDFVFNDLAKPLLSDIPISTKRDNGTYRAWQGFRFLANIMLIGSMLAIVYAQARGEK
ncbi:MAG TPA: hypothetical protein VFK11_00375 [Candidatus Saccharimonadales bacterium]|nr:hypothetical protein [Candidatus Saccharimonadales bacterium]